MLYIPGQLFIVLGTINKWRVRLAGTHVIALTLFSIAENFSITVYGHIIKAANIGKKIPCLK